MLIAGASGHAIEILSILRNETPEINPVFFDDTNSPVHKTIARYQILRTLEEAKFYFDTNPGFILGVGKPTSRKILFEKLNALGGELKSIISNHALIGIHEVTLDRGLNIFPFASLAACVFIGLGTLIHSHVSVHHDCIIGEFCELSPGCRVLGNVRIEDNVSLGAGSVILPGRRIGAGAIVGAGAVVTKDVEPNTVVVGVPAKLLHK